MTEFTITVNIVGELQPGDEKNLHEVLVDWAETRRLGMIILPDRSEKIIAELCDAIHEAMNPLGKSYSKAIECLRKYSKRF